MENTYGWNGSFNEDRSVMYAHSGLINGNPFVICRTKKMIMGEKTISIEQVQAVLFDNGNFKEYPKYTSPVVENESIVSENKNLGYTTQRQSVQQVGWNSFDPNGEKLWLSGWCTAGSGLGVLLVGTICAAVGDGPGPDGVGATFISLGSISLAASIPLLTIGGMRKFKKNDKSAETAQSYILELQAQKNQIGLALKF